MDDTVNSQMFESNSVFDLNNSKFEDYFNKVTESSEEIVESVNNMLSSEYYAGFLDVVQVRVWLILISS